MACKSDGMSNPAFTSLASCIISIGTEKHTQSLWQTAPSRKFNKNKVN